MPAAPSPADFSSAPAISGGDRLPARCPRCGGGFECGADSGHCECFGIRLTDTLRAELAARYAGCLCLRCLREVMAGASADPLPAPR